MQCPGRPFSILQANTSYSQQILHGFNNFELYAVDTEGQKQPVRVTDSDGFDGLACFSPDGKTLSWTSNRTNDKKSQIFMANWNHKEMLKRLDSAQSIENIRQLEKSPSSVTKTSPEVEADDVVKHVKYLCSEKLGGRMTGSQGNQLASAFRPTHSSLMEWNLFPKKTGGFKVFHFSIPLNYHLHANLISPRTSTNPNPDWI